MKNFLFLKYSTVVLFFILLLIVIQSSWISQCSMLCPVVFILEAYLNWHSSSKLSTSSRIYHVYLQGITWQLINTTLCYTGSFKNDNRAGFAYFIGVKIFSDHHRHSSSILIAELEEILQFLQYYLQLTKIFLHSCLYKEFTLVSTFSLLYPNISHLSGFKSHWYSVKRTS